jgi:hypothetical protein
MSNFKDVQFAFDLLFSYWFGVGFMCLSPFIILFAQLVLMVREFTIYSRKELNSNDSYYELSKWIASALVYIGVLMFFLGVVFYVWFLANK